VGREGGADIVSYRQLLPEAVVLVPVNLVAQTILSVVYRGSFASRQVAVVVFAVVADAMVQPGFLMFQRTRFPGRQLPAPHALRDAVLLAFPALVYGGRAQCAGKY
jgi:hypothetical protein